jgi:hypothetical protein
MQFKISQSLAGRNLRLLFSKSEKCALVAYLMYLHYVNDNDLIFVYQILVCQNVKIISETHHY